MSRLPAPTVPPRTPARRVQPPPVRYMDRTLAGTPAEVARVLHLAAAAGRLVEHTAPVPDPYDSRRVVVYVRLLPPPAAPRRLARRRRRLVRIAVPVAAGAGVLFVAGCLLVPLLIREVTTAAKSALPTVAGGAVVLLALLWLAAGRAGVCCPGLHCPGCRHR
jgi:hypothetical protein